jgi:methylglyoxal synthase
MHIALIAHDKKKSTMITFVKEYEELLKVHTLYGTGTTGLKIMEMTDLRVHRFKSGPLGGDQEIGAYIANGKIDLVIFFRDPLTSQPHEPDVNALLRLCDVYDVPVATNKTSAAIFCHALKQEEGIFKA